MILLFVFLSMPGLAVDKQECSKLANEASMLLQKFNSAFQLDVKLEFAQEAFGPLIASDKMTLAVANAAKKGAVVMPAPCKLVQSGESYGRETYLLVLAHEYAHKLLDGEAYQCDNVWKKSQNGKSEEEIAMAESMGHANIDTLALKILDHFKIDKTKAVSGFSKFLSESKGDSRRIRFLKSSVRTNFNKGHDLLYGPPIANVDKIANFLGVHYPSSALSRRFDKHFRQDQGCHVFNPNDWKHTIEIWKGADRRATKNNLPPQVR